MTSPRRSVPLVTALVMAGLLAGCGSSAHGDLDMGTLASQIKSSVAIGTASSEWQNHVTSVTCVKTAALEASCALEANSMEANEPGTYNEKVTISANGEAYEASTPTK